MRRSIIGLAASACVVLLGSRGSVQAQSFPDRPLPLIVPFAAGGAAPATERRGGEAMQRLVGSEVARWVDIIKKANLPEQQ